MSNKKLFGIIFIILSCCEFGQIAYSKSSSVAIKPVHSHSAELQCDLKKVTDDCQARDEALASYSLPR